MTIEMLKNLLKRPDSRQQILYPQDPHSSAPKHPVTFVIILNLQKRRFALQTEKLFL